MERMPFTPEGVQAKQAEINELAFEERLMISDNVAKDPALFIRENFELTDEQNEYLSSLEIADLRITGFSLAIGLLGQVPIEMQDTTPPSAFAARGKKKKKLSVGITTTTNPQTGATTVGGNISYTWEW
ncbi:hypothetical protein [Chryseobacterium sp. 2987]|uniref:hypothetical protein n=1 Tax=Chryseobacterium sp. 2987 TaxID=2817767 RepID=UPI00285F1B04|nr:hypothetical protein [Chryseobacterium sp. 2987]MDR6922843.1 hypothetical protein [Chryseobacterium sp. 2987]